MPPASSAERSFATSGGWLKCSCISVPPVNSMLYFEPAADRERAEPDQDERRS